MPFNKSEIKNILVISLSNLGDVILTFPVIDVLRRDFPHTHLSVVVGPKAEALFQGNPYIDRAFIFDKHSTIREKILWVLNLRRMRFDLVIDLRNTAIPFLISAKYRTSARMSSPTKVHMKIKHLDRLKSVCDFAEEPNKRYAFHISAEDMRTVDQLVKTKIGEKRRFLIVGPGAANHIKRWTEEGFVRLCDEFMANHQVQIVLVGDKTDIPVANAIASKMRLQPLNLCGQTTMPQLGELLRRSSLAIVNDSAIMHLASYLDVPVVAFFGPTDAGKYGPWSKKSLVIRKELFCAPCEKSGCAYHHECMEYIKPEEVFRAIRLTPTEVTFENYAQI